MCSMIKNLNNHVYNLDIYLIIYQSGRVAKWCFAHFNCHKSQVQLPNKQMDSKPGINIQASLNKKLQMTRWGDAVGLQGRILGLWHVKPIVILKTNN